MQNAITYVGLDVNKDSIVVSLAEAGLRGDLREVREYGKIRNAPAALKALATKLAAKGNELRFCYEAGPCGYGVQRQLSGMGHQCAVVAPSLIPRKPGERIKTDRRDAIKLAKLHGTGAADGAFSLRWFVHPQSERPTCIDQWEACQRRFDFAFATCVDTVI